MAKILIVDDDADFTAIVRDALESVGHYIINAESAREGYETAIEEKPDLIIADLMMETNDAGFILCHRIKNTPSMSSTPIIMMTAVTQETGFKFSLDDPQQAEWIKADQYIDKPVSPAMLIEKVNQLLKSKK